VRQQSLKKSETFFHIEKEEKGGQEESIGRIQGKVDQSTHTQSPCLDSMDVAVDIDERRIKRIQQRAQQQAVKASKSKEKLARGGVMKSAKKQPLSASFVMQCGKETDEESRKLLPMDHCWYACKTVLKGVL